MGLGLVLLFWGIAAVLAAGVVAAVLVAVVWFVARAKRRALRGWLVMAAVLPFASLAYAAAGFVAYAVYCEVVRDVDLGIGDSWRVPLGNGYRLVMVDTPDQAFVDAPRDRQLHFGLKRIGRAGDLVVGEDALTIFVIDTQRGTERTLSSESELEAAVPRPRSDKLQLLAPEQFYQAHRWGLLDGVAAAFIIGPPLVVFLMLARRFLGSD